MDEERPADLAATAATGAGTPDAGAGPSTAAHDPASWPIAEAIRADPGASPDPAICPFLRAEDPSGQLGRPITTADAAHRCAALVPPTALAERQQAVVCLRTVHLDCPRYLRGILVVPVAPPGPAPGRRVPRATIAAGLVLLASLAIAISAVIREGGPTIPGGVDSTPGPGATTAALASPSPGASPAPTMTASATTPSATTVAPSTSASPSQAASPGPSASSGPTSDRLALLRPCPDRPDCYLYTVRAGDNLTSIGLYFGVPFETIRRLNPWITDPSVIHKGDRIVLPTPTR